MDQDKPSAPDNPARKTEPALSPKKQAQQQRLAEALRANLRRRKEQVRQRNADPGGETGS
jgi:hypothetical protein